MIFQFTSFLSAFCSIFSWKLRHDTLGKLQPLHLRFFGGRGGKGREGAGGSAQGRTAVIFYGEDSSNIP